MSKKKKTAKIQEGSLSHADTTAACLLLVGERERERERHGRGINKHSFPGGDKRHAQEHTAFMDPPASRFTRRITEAIDALGKAGVDTDLP